MAAFAAGVFFFGTLAPAQTDADHQMGTPVREILSVSSAAAATAIDVGIAEAELRSAKVCIIVLDEAGRFMAGRCMDGATNSAFDVAMAKAKHSANFKRPTSFQEDLLINRNALQILSIPGMLPLEGGLPLEHGGRQVGAVGVSGAASEIDGMIAAAVQAVVGR